MSKPIIDNLVLEVIDRGLDALGPSGKKAVWFYLEQDPSFHRQNIPENLEDFEMAMQNLFGLGYNFLETVFRRDLQESTGQDFDSDKSFSECVSSLRASQFTGGPSREAGKNGFFH